MTSKLANASLFICLAAASVSFAQTGPRLLLEPLPKGQNYQLNTEAAWFERSDLDNTSNDLGMMTYEASGRARFELGAITQTIQRAQPRIGFDLFAMDLFNDDALLPGQFTDVSVGASFGILSQDKWVAGIALGVGFASANAFQDANGLYIKADLAVGYTIDERQTFGLVLTYDGNRSIFPDIPLPGFQYTNRYSDELTFSIGFPFTGLTYKPDDKWTFEVTFAIPDNFAGKIDYGFTKEFGAFVQLTNKNVAFKWNELEDSTDRVIFSQSRAELGLRGTINEKASFVIAGGYAFNQEFEAGFDSRDADTIAKLDPSLFGRLGFELRF